MARRDRKGFQALEQRVKKQVELEDKRVKELTEAILYDFVPTAMDVLLPKTDDPASELHADRCQVKPYPCFEKDPAESGQKTCAGSAGWGHRWRWTLSRSLGKKYPGFLGAGF